jgi:outer membrane scaffolding protein for murein synthesis (MipA/OmpV family)
MLRFLALIISSSLAVPAWGADVFSEPPVDPPGYGAPATDDDVGVIFYLGAAAGVSPRYDGADDYIVYPYPLLAVSFLRLPGIGEVGSREGTTRGFFIYPSFRFIGERNASDNAALTGLNTVDWALEAGFGVGYRYAWFRGFTTVRYGFNGYNGWIAEFGADAVWDVNDRLQLSLGPRLSIAGDEYMDTYFGVTPAESAASIFPVYDPDAGMRAVGVNAILQYDFNDDWRGILELGYEHLVGDAEDSPILSVGSADQFTAGIGLTRKFSLNF